MKCWEIFKEIEETFPLTKAYDWDNVGHLVGDEMGDVEKIYVALDATNHVIEEAIQWGADLIITHHPLIFSPIKKINTKNFISARVVNLLQNKVNCYAMHTNYDVVRMSELVEKKIDLLSSQILEFTDLDKTEGLGRIGSLKEIATVREVGEKIKERFGLESLTIYGDLEKKVKEIAFLPGSGKSGIETALNKGADLYITGDIGYHEGVDAVNRGLVIIDAGHYGLEYIFIEDMCNYLKERWGEIEVKGAEIIQPFQTI